MKSAFGFGIKVIVLTTFSISSTFFNSQGQTKDYLVSELSDTNKCLYEHFVKSMKASAYEPDSVRFYHKVRFTRSGNTLTIRAFAKTKGYGATQDVYGDQIMYYGIDYQIPPGGFNCHKRNWKTTKLYYEGGGGVIDTDFFLENEDQYDRVSYCFKDHVLVKKNGLYGVVDRNNDITVPIKYPVLKMRPFGLCVEENGKYYFISKKNGEMVSARKYESVSLIMKVNGKRYASVKFEDKYALIDDRLNETTGFIFDGIYHVYNFHSLKAQIGDEYYLINPENGKCLSKGYTNIKLNPLNQKHLFYVEKNNLFGIIDTSGTELLSPDYEKLIYDVFDSFCIIKHSEKDFLIFCYKTREIQRVKYDYSKTFFLDGNLLGVTDKNGKQGAVNGHGQMVIPVKYDRISFRQTAPIKPNEFHATTGENKTVFDVQGNCLRTCN